MNVKSSLLEPRGCEGIKHYPWAQNLGSPSKPISQVMCVAPGRERMKQAQRSLGTWWRAWLTEAAPGFKPRSLALKPASFSDPSADLNLAFPLPPCRHIENWRGLHTSTLWTWSSILASKSCECTSSPVGVGAGGWGPYIVQASRYNLNPRPPG